MFAIRRVGMLCGACVALVMFVGCTDQAKQAVKDAKEDAANAAKHVKDAAKDSADAAGDAAKDAADKAGAAVKEAGEAMSEKFAEAKEKAAAALKDVEGGPAILDNINSMIEKTKDSLASVKDTETAKTAATTLDGLGAKIGDWESMVAKLPDQAKAAIHAMVEQAKPTLEAMAQKAMAIPGVEAVLKPAVDGLMTKLSALTAKAA